MSSSFVSLVRRLGGGLLLLLGCGTSAARPDADEPASAEPATAESRAARSGGSSLGSPRAARPGRSSLGSPEPGPAVADDGPRWRVLSFNINFGVGHAPSNPAAVVEADADLVLLQETTDESERVFREQLSERYPHILFRQCCNAGGLGVLSRHPILEEDYLEATVGWFPAWRVVIDTPLGPVQVLNVHLRPPMSDGGSWVAGYFSTRGVRRDEMEDFWALMDPKLPTVVAGDFNENAEGKAVGFLAEQGLRSALAQVKPRAKTWRWQTRMGKIRAMLDHIVYSEALGLHEAKVLERGTSDHFPVLAVLGPAG